MPDPYLVEIGKRIRLRRVAISMTQTELGEISCLHRTYVSGVEGGKRNPTILVLKRLAVGLQMTMQSLLKE